MWIFLGIIAFLILLITFLLLSPVYVIIKNDDNNEFFLRYKYLFWTFGEDPDPNNPIIKTLKDASGITRLEKKNLESNVKRSGLSDTVNQTLRMLVDLLGELAKLLKYCTFKKFMLTIVCAEAEAEDTAVSYGQCCATVYPTLGFLNSIIKFRKRGSKINISCDYESKKEIFLYDCLLSVSLSHVLAAFFRVAWKEAKRTNEALPQTPSAKPKYEPKH